MVWPVQSPREGRGLEAILDAPLHRRLPLALCGQALWLDDNRHVLILIRQRQVRLVGGVRPLLATTQARQELHCVTAGDGRGGDAALAIQQDIVAP